MYDSARDTGVRATPGTADDGQSGLDGADHAFHTVCAGTSRLVQLLADELVPLPESTVAEMGEIIDSMQRALPHLASWRTIDSALTDWVLEPPLAAVGVRLDGPSDLYEQENAARLRRSLDLLAPGSLALRKEAAVVVVDALIELLRTAR
jgi:hypothetical protein